MVEVVKGRKLLLASIIKPKAAKVDRAIDLSKNNDNFTNEISLYDYRQNLIEVLDELELVGLNTDKIKLIAGDNKCCYWFGDLNVSNCFDKNNFLYDEVVDFSQQLFNRGNYLLLINGTEDELDIAYQIIHGCELSTNIWYF